MNDEYRTWIQATVLTAISEDQGTADRVTWCVEPVRADARLKDIPKVWARAVAVLKLPEDVRQDAKWN